MEVGQVALGEREHLSDSLRLFERGRDDLTLEDLLGGVDGRQLELLLGAEVGVEAALAHADVVGEAPDRQALEALDRGQLGSALEDDLPGCAHRRDRCRRRVTVVSEVVICLDKIARSVVLSSTIVRSQVKEQR